MAGIQQIPGGQSGAHGAHNSKPLGGAATFNGAEKTAHEPGAKATNLAFGQINQGQDNKDVHQLNTLA